MNRILLAQRALCLTVIRNGPKESGRDVAQKQVGGFKKYKKDYDYKASVNPLTIETRGKVMIIKINRPQQRNAINKDLSNQLYTTLKSLNAITTSTIAAVVIGSTGEDFCAGYDLKEISDKGLEELVIHVENKLKPDQSPMGVCQLKINKPVICAIEGACVAGGMEIAMWADLRVGAQNSYYGVFNRRFGVPLIDGGTVRLPAMIGQGRALDLIMTGRKVSAEEAQSIGLINRTVAPGQTIQEAIKLANDIISQPYEPMINDRDIVYSNQNLKTFDEKMMNERKVGVKSLRSAFKTGSIERFAKGYGRHGNK